jgi:hypothetical protein
LREEMKKLFQEELKDVQLPGLKFPNKTGEVEKKPKADLFYLNTYTTNGKNQISYEVRKNNTRRHDLTEKSYEHMTSLMDSNETVSLEDFSKWLKEGEPAEKINSLQKANKLSIVFWNLIAIASRNAYNDMYKQIKVNACGIAIANFIKTLPNQGVKKVEDVTLEHFNQFFSPIWMSLTKLDKLSDGNLTEEPEGVRDD